MKLYFAQKREKILISQFDKDGNEHLIHFTADKVDAIIEWLSKVKNNIVHFDKVVESWETQ